ncbi:hypothetical protein Y032_1227g3772, partial [Ancylostoma ceylanicum]
LPEPLLHFHFEMLTKSLQLLSETTKVCNCYLRLCAPDETLDTLLCIFLLAVSFSTFSSNREQ